MLIRWLRKDPLSDADHVVPKWLPLIFFVPNVRTLKQWHHQPLGLHENHLWSADLGFHLYFLAAFKGHEIAKKYQLLLVAGIDCGSKLPGWSILIRQSELRSFYSNLEREPRSAQVRGRRCPRMGYVIAGFEDVQT